MYSYKPSPKRDTFYVPQVVLIPNKCANILFSILFACLYGLAKLQ